jgi:hypothetical protein
MEAALSSETFLFYHNTTRRHNLEHDLSYPVFSIRNYLQWIEAENILFQKILELKCEYHRRVTLCTVYNRVRKSWNVVREPLRDPNGC